MDSLHEYSLMEKKGKKVKIKYWVIKNPQNLFTVEDIINEYNVHQNDKVWFY